MASISSWNFERLHAVQVHAGQHQGPGVSGGGGARQLGWYVPGQASQERRCPCERDAGLSTGEWAHSEGSWGDSLTETTGTPECGMVV